MSTHRDPTLIGTAPAFLRTLEAVDRAAKSDAPVVLVGESGSGKGALAARAHAHGQRRNRPMFIVAPAGMPRAALDAKLFADATEGATLVIDEICALPLDVQSRLLGAIEDGASDVRIVVATDRPLVQSLEDGHLRRDLYYRLDALSIAVPALRDRREDVPRLVTHFFARARIKNPSSPARDLAPAVLSQLSARDWPGNVRELSSVVEHAVVFASRPQIELDDLAASPHGMGFPGAPLPDAPCSLSTVTSRYIEWVLSRTDGDKARAAAILEVDVSTLYRWQRRRNAER